MTEASETKHLETKRHSPAKESARIPAPSVSIYFDGRYDGDRGTVVDGTFATAVPLPLRDAPSTIIGRDEDCTVRLDLLATTRVLGLSRKAVVIERVNGLYRMWVRSKSGGAVYFPGGRVASLAVSTEEDPEPPPEQFEVLNHTVVELVAGTFTCAHLVFDVPRASVLPPPSFAGDPNAPATVVAGQARYSFTPADKEMLVAVCPDKVVTPPFGIEMASTPAQAVRMLQARGAAYFEGKAQERYDADKLNQTIAAFVRRIDEIEDAAHVEDSRRLRTLVDLYKEGGHAGTWGIDEWLSTRPEVVAILDFEMAVEMRKIRDLEIARARERKAEAGRLGALAAASKRGTTSAAGTDDDGDAPIALPGRPRRFPTSRPAAAEQVGGDR